jgi:pimeloyl-ACP methyl ester carboxylesterase
VSIVYEVHGTAGPTLLLLPTWTIIHSRFWKMQVPYLARHFRVVTYDSPGNGAGDRSLDPEVYGVAAHLRYTTAVLDAVEADAAVLVGLSQGAQYAVSFAGEHPERVLGLVLIGPALALQPEAAGERSRFIWSHFEEPYPPQEPSGVPFGRPDTPDWWKYNRHYWGHDLGDFAWFFFGQAFPEPHSTKPIEDCVGWTLETSGEILGAEYDSPMPERARFREWAAGITCPVTVIHGTDDRIVPFEVGRMLAEATHGELVTLDGAGHLPLVRDPVRVNLVVKDFVDRIARTVGV